MTNKDDLYESFPKNYFFDFIARKKRSLLFFLILSCLSGFLLTDKSKFESKEIWRGELIAKSIKSVSIKEAASIDNLIADHLTSSYVIKPIFEEMVNNQFFEQKSYLNWLEDIKVVDVGDVILTYESDNQNEVKFFIEKLIENYYQNKDERIREILKRRDIYIHCL